MENGATRRLLTALAGAIPEEGPSQLTGLSIRQGWGGIVNVRVHTSASPTAADWELGRALSTAVQIALDGRRHELSFVWEPTPQDIQRRSREGTSEH
jgi:hypothetical protein